jgi:hypothetical protein
MKVLSLLNIWVLIILKSIFVNMLRLFMNVTSSNNFKNKGDLFIPIIPIILIIISNLNNIAYDLRMIVILIIQPIVPIIMLLRMKFIDKINIVEYIPIIIINTIIGLIVLINM